ncbi:MAG TPA: PEGA domain-containing protein [Verrucomicrobiae bacterium]|nr:PEGA domain-containing protein [Verrucomicrobiae bacterium]
MKWWSIALGLWMSASLLAQGQVSEIEKKQFEQVKARADRGDAQAELELGNLYATGRGVSRDFNKAAKWHRKAAEQGLAKAQMKVAYEFANGVGVKSDHVEAARWLQRAAAQGLADAQLQLGLCYASGDGVAEDHVEATKWYSKAADQNLAEAQQALATCYFEGNGVTKDIPEAINLTRKAAEQGLAAAENALGMCYAKGRGVPQDYVQAYKWLNLAGAQGSDSNVEAKMNLSMAERAMTPDQIAKAQELARQFKPKSPSSQTAVAANSTPSAAKTGFLDVKADDETCEVYADGTFVGNAPAKLKLAPGLHTIEVKKSGYKDYRKQITISDGSELTLRAKLEQ